MSVRSEQRSQGYASQRNILRNKVGIMIYDVNIWEHVLFGNKPKNSGMPFATFFLIFLEIKIFLFSEGQSGSLWGKLTSSDNLRKQWLTLCNSHVCRAGMHLRTYSQVLYFGELVFYLSFFHLMPLNTSTPLRFRGKHCTFYSFELSL